MYDTNDAVYAHTDGLGNTTRFEYNPFNGRTDVTHPDGGRETHFYDSHMNVVRFVSPEGRVEENEYDKEKKERTVERDPFGFETQMSIPSSSKLLVRGQTTPPARTAATDYPASPESRIASNTPPPARRWHRRKDRCRLPR